MGPRIVGFVQLTSRPEEGSGWGGHWLFSLSVQPRYRGLGIGDALTQAVIDRTVADGAPTLRLAVYEDNFRAVGLYEKLGFEKIVVAALEPGFLEEKAARGRRRIVMREATGRDRMTDATRPERRTMEVQAFPLWDKMKGKRVPLSFDLEVTARCSADCRHCYINLPAGDAAARAEELTAKEILGIARQAADLGAMWCLVTGGEPLLRDDFEEIYLGLKRLGLLVSVFTNACLVTQRHVDLWKKYPPRDIEVTVYGVTRETYEAVTRRPGSFDAFMRGLDLLLASGIRVRLKAMAIKSNLHEYDGHRRVLPGPHEGLLPLRPAAPPALRRRRRPQPRDPRRSGSRPRRSSRSRRPTRSGRTR